MWTNMFAIVYYCPTAVNAHTFLYPFTANHILLLCTWYLYLEYPFFKFVFFPLSIFCFWLCWCNTHSEYDKQHKSCLPYLNRVILVSTVHDSSLVVNNAWEITMDVFPFDGQRATSNIKEKKKQQLCDAQRLTTKQKSWEKAEIMCAQLLLKCCWNHKWFDGVRGSRSTTFFFLPSFL